MFILGFTTLACCIMVEWNLPQKTCFEWHQRCTMVPLTLELERGMLYYICSNSLLAFLVATYTGWWFQTFFIFHNIWDNPSHWLIFFKMVKTTNQYIYNSIYGENSLGIPFLTIMAWRCRGISLRWTKHHGFEIFGAHLETSSG